MTYDPNDPKRTNPVDSDPATPKEAYVEPVERRSSPLPLIIGVLLALALAYFVLQRFMTDDTVAVEGDTTTVTTMKKPLLTRPSATKLPSKSKTLPMTPRLLPKTPPPTPKPQRMKLQPRPRPPLKTLRLRPRTLPRMLPTVPRTWRTTQPP